MLLGRNCAAYNVDQSSKFMIAVEHLNPKHFCGLLDESRITYIRISGIDGLSIRMLAATR